MTSIILRRSIYMDSFYNAFKTFLHLLTPGGSEMSQVSFEMF